MPDVVYLGPDGSFSSLVARTRFPRAKRIPAQTIGEVFEWVKRRKDRVGIAPVENSSGGMILDTVDLLIDPGTRLLVREELALHVRLALLGRKGEKIARVYSHYVPLGHSLGWLREHYPEAEPIKVSSTSEAARRVAQEPNAAALSTRDAAALYGLDVLHFPVQEQLVNLTQFFVLGHTRVTRATQQTSVVASLKNEVGSLCAFLMPFRDERISVKRIFSRPVVGHPNIYTFFLSFEAAESSPNMKRALEEARAHCTMLRSLGSYPAPAPMSS